MSQADTDGSSSRPRESGPQPGVAPLVFSALFGFSLLLFAVGYLLDSSPLRLVALIAAAIFGVGSAPLQLSLSVPLDVRFGVAVLAGLSTPLVAGSVLVLLPWWHPLLAVLVVGAAAVVMHVLGCRRVLAQVPPEAIIRVLRPRYRSVLSLSVAATLLGSLLWVVAALTTAQEGNPGVLGFLPKISLLWYVGLLLLIAGLVLARGKPESQAMFSTVSLLAALTVTPAIVYVTPRSQSAAKHMDLVEMILRTHQLSLDSSVNIYKAYSGMFSGTAWLCQLAGVRDVTGVAAYWPFAIDLAVLVALRFFFGRLTSSPYRVWAAILLAFLVNAIGADYFSPQAVGFALALGVFGLALCRDIPGLSERLQLALLLFAGCALAVTHELSPYLAGAALAILVIFRIIRPWYSPATILIPAILWAWLHKSALSGFLSIDAFGSLSNFAPPTTIATPGLSRLPIVGEMSDALALGLVVLILLAAFAWVRNITDKKIWAYLLCSGGGLLLIAGNSYGNEGIFRAALFAIPWLAATAMSALRGRAPRWMSGVYAAIAVGLTATYLVAMFGQDNQAVIRSADLQALQVYQDQASPDSYILSLSYGDVPVGLSFPDSSSHYVDWNTLLTSGEVQQGHPRPSDSNAVARAYVRYAVDNGGPTNQLYAIMSPAAVDYAVNYGLETASQANSWREIISSSNDWTLVWDKDGTYLFRVNPGVKPGPQLKTLG